MKTMNTDFGQALSSGRLVLTAECLPPRRADADTMRRLSSALPDLLDAVVVPDNADGIHGSALACAALLAREGRQVVLTMSTRDRNRIALESDALGAAALGVRGILCVSGNHQTLGVCPQAAGANDLDSIQLTQTVKALDLPGMAVGGVAHPCQKPMELNVLRARKKVNAGVDFLLTQPVFDLAAFTAWMDAMRAAGLDQRTAIIASVLPLSGVEHAESVRRHQTYGLLDEAVVSQLADAADPGAEGVAMAAKTAAQLKAIPGVRGIHILSGGAEAVTERVITAAGLA
jgi:methylenetetrahydrofolate reductase (NADPH)